jgi:hypothetical protein
MYQLDIISSEPDFETFKVQLKNYLEAFFGMDFFNLDNSGTTLKDNLDPEDIRRLADMVFDNQEQTFIEILNNVQLKGNGPCPSCGCNNLAMLHFNDREPFHVYKSIPENGEYECIQGHKFSLIYED